MNPNENNLDSVIFVINNDSIKYKSTKSIEFVMPYNQFTATNTSTNLLSNYNQILIVYNLSKEIPDTTIQLTINIKNYFDFKTKEIQLSNFQIGSENGLNDENPVIDIILKHKLQVSLFEINQRTWYSVMNTNKSSTKNIDYAVDSITWIDAIIFCNRLSILYNLEEVYNIIDTTNQNVEFNQNANGWRLPTEAEWEYLAKGNTLDDTFQNQAPSLVGWYGANSGMKICPSGEKTANINGLYDMNGNVWEWCWDFYQSNSYSQITKTENPTGVSNGSRRVRRGGSFRTGEFFIRASNRSVDDNNLYGTGLRLVRNNK
jgi:formylglycine-generating enzyme required for sulfatase activity